MNIKGSIALKMLFITAIIPIAIAITVAVADGDAGDMHKIPDAPPEYLDMVNPNDSSVVDERFLKKASKLYKLKCKKCHGIEGDGNGPNAESFEIKPAAFSKPGYLAQRKDGQLFWIMMYGSENTEMAPVGPDSDIGLSEQQLWQLIAYLRYRFTN